MGESLGGISGFNALRIENALIPDEGPKAIPVTVPFSTGTLAWDIDLSLTIQQRRISLIQAVFIDNSIGSGVFSIVAETTGQTIRIPAGAQAYLPLLAGQIPRFRVERGSPDNTFLLFLNVPVPALLWQGASGGIAATVAQGAPGALPWPVAIEDTNGALGPSNPLPVVLSPAGVTQAFSVTILATQSESGTLANPDVYSPVNIVGPSGWDAADLLILGSLDGVSFQPIYDVTGTALAFPFAASRSLAIAPALVMGWPFLRFRSVSTSDPTSAVAQGANRVLAGTLQRI